ncbi:MAG: SBBP repeat-containing protein [Planctomycetes bacterium]|nr:SBBP repeat-containing protein [Planctomycetota bacterium]
MKDFGSIPLLFVENCGQVDPAVKFMARHAGAITYLTDEGFTIKLGRLRGDLPDIVQSEVEKMGKRNVVEHAAFFRFINCEQTPVVTPMELQPSIINYRIGKDSSHWGSNCKSYKSVLYDQLYPNTGVRFYELNGALEYDIIAQRGADLSKIEIECKGVSNLRVNERGQLVGETPLGDICQGKPVAWAENADGGKARISCEFEIRRTNIFAFRTEPVGKYDKITIDPGVLLFGKYLGGSGVDRGWGVAVDASGSAYVTGETLSSDYPTSPVTGYSTFDTSANGSVDAFITKLGGIGRSIIYSTYFGGSGNDISYAVDVDSRGCAYVCGVTSSSDFPLGGTPVFYGLKGTTDGFIARFSFNGFPTYQNPPSPLPPGLLWDDYQGWATYFGGVGDDGCLDIALEPGLPASFPISCSAPPLSAYFPRILVCGFVSSPTPPFPPPTSFQGSDWAGIVNTYSSMNSNLMPYLQYPQLTTTNPIPPPNKPAYGTSDAFVAQFIDQPILSFTGTTDFDYLWYIGGSGNESARGVAWLPDGTAVVCGVTTSLDLPVTTANALQPTFGGGASDGFVCFLQAQFTSYCPQSIVAGSLRIGYLSYLGGSGDDEARGIVSDFRDTAYIVGTTTSTNLATTPGAFSTSINHGAGGNSSDAFVTALKISTFQPSFPPPPGLPNITMQYLTYLGGSSNDEGFAISLDSGALATVTGFTSPIIFAYDVNGLPVYGSDFPKAPQSGTAIDFGYFGQKDVFISQLNAGGTALNYSFLSGGAQDDAGYSIAIDINGDQYVTGETWSGNFHVTPGVLAPTAVGVAFLGPVDAFIQKFH